MAAIDLPEEADVVTDQHLDQQIAPDRAESRQNDLLDPARPRE